MNTLKIIEGQEDYFKKEFVGIIPDIDPFIIDEATPEKILNWHKQSIIQILQSEIERKRGMKKDGQIICALEEDIAHLTNLLDSLK